MNNTATITTTKKERVNFWASSELVERASKAAQALNHSLSEFTREALEHRVEKIEREKIDQEVALACKEFYDIDAQLARDWAQFETKIE